MRNLPLLSLLSLAVLLPAVQSFFLGPIAVGAAVGALFVAKGLFLGAFLSRRRSHVQTYRSRRSNDYQPRYTTRRPYWTTTHHYNQPHHTPDAPYAQVINARDQYQPSHHYDTDYNTRYTQPRTYYYSSQRSQRRNRYGKREAMAVDHMELARFRREIQDSMDTGAWYLEMVEKDQDDCTKRLICEMAARNASGPLQGVEDDLSQAFGLGNSIDVSSPKAVFDMAAQSGKLMGKKRCEEFYKRCDTPVSDILNMIKTELEEFTKLEEELMKEEDPLAMAEVVMKKETKEMAAELKAAGVDVEEEMIWN